MSGATLDAVPSRRRSFITGLGIGQVVSWGTTYYAFPVVADRMAVDLGVTRADLYGGATLAFLIAAVAAYPVGAWIDRGHGRTVMSIGALISALLLLAWSQTSSLLQFYFVFAGIGVAQAMCLYEPAFAVVARRYGSGAARSGITAVTLWGGFASTVFVPLTEFLAVRIGWRDAILVLALTNILFALLPYLLVIRPKDDLPLEHETAPSLRGPVQEAVRVPAFWCLLVAFVSYYVAFMVVTYHLYPLLRERGFDAATVVAGMALIGPAQVAGRIVMWALTSRITVPQLGIAVFAGLPLAIGMLWWLPATFVWLALWALLHGAINGVMTIVRGLAVPELVTRRAYGTVNALLAAPSNVAKALAPLGAAIAWEASQSYGPVLVGCIAISAVGLLGFAAAVVIKRETS